MLCGKEFRKSASYHGHFNRCVSVVNEYRDDEVILLRAVTTCQQTTFETMTNVCEETSSRLELLERECHREQHLLP